jgi:hypothetical protein
MELWPPTLLQGFPHRPPVLRGRFHHDFLDLLRDQPVGEAAQIARRRPGLLVLELEVAIDLDVGHDDASIFLWTSIRRDWQRGGRGTGADGDGQEANSHHASRCFWHLFG